MSFQENDFRPVGPGWTVHVLFSDTNLGTDEPSDLIGWTWKNGGWCPTFWEPEMQTQAMTVVDPKHEDFTAVFIGRRDA